MWTPGRRDRKNSFLLYQITNIRRLRLLGTRWYIASGKEGAPTDYRMLDGTALLVTREIMREKCGRSQQGWKAAGSSPPTAGEIRVTRLSGRWGESQPKRGLFQRQGAEGQRVLQDVPSVPWRRTEPPFELFRFAFVLVFFFPPHRRATGAGESGIESQAGEDPAVQDKPDRHDAEQDEKFHRCTSKHMEINIYHLGP